MKALKAFHAPGLDGSPASLQKELDGLEESLKGWEERDERREASFETWKKINETLRADRDAALLQISELQKELAGLRHTGQHMTCGPCEQLRETQKPKGGT